MQDPTRLRSWLEDNLRGEFSLPRVRRKMKEEGVPDEEGERLLREVAAAKWKRGRKSAVLQIAGGAAVVLTVLLPSPLRLIQFLIGAVGIGNGLWTWRRAKGFARVAGGGTPEPAASSGAPKWIVAGVAAVLLMAAGAVGSLALLGPDWLKAKLVALARERLHAELRIDSLTFSPWTGEAELKGVSFERKSPDSDVLATVESVRTKIRIAPLFRRSVGIERLEIERPKIEWTVRQPKDSGRATTWEKLKNLAGGVARARDAGSRWEVGELVIRDGIVEFCSLQEVGEAFLARASGVQYRAKDVSLGSFGGLLTGADVDANLDLGGATAILKKKGSAVPSTFSLSRIHLAHADRYFDQSDALVVSGGAADVRYTLGDGVRVEVDLKGLRLGENPSAPKQEFAFVPVSRLREIVNAREGNFRLSFAMEEGIEASGDLRLLVDEVWAGMWKALALAVGEGAIKGTFKRPAPREEK